MLGEESQQNGATFIVEFNKSSIDVAPFICEDLGTIPNNSKIWSLERLNSSIYRPDYKLPKVCKNNHMANISLTEWVTISDPLEKSCPTYE